MKATKICKGPGCERPAGLTSKYCSRRCSNRNADARRNARRPKRVKVRVPKRPPPMRRFRVSLRGGVITLGSDAFELTVTGHVHVMARTWAEAREAALQIVARMHDEGRLLPDEGLDLEATTARPVAPGDVEELEAAEEPAKETA